VAVVAASDVFEQARRLSSDMDGRRADDEAPRAHPLFVRSLNPMLIVDDERRYVDANAAACLFMRLSREEICKLRIDDVTPPHMRAGMPALWTEFLKGRFSRAGMQALGWAFQMPDGTRVAVDLSSTPDFQLGRHLAIVVFPPAEDVDERVARAPMPESGVLTKREREVLTLVALGNTGVQIAAELFVSPATVQTHVVNTLIKLGAKNRAHGIAIAMQTGELDLGDDLTIRRL
jgi:DNA-binding CsgD family transcriptional regulator